MIPIRLLLFLKLVEALLYPFFKSLIIQLLLKQLLVCNVNTLDICCSRWRTRRRSWLSSWSRFGLRSISSGDTFSRNNTSSLSCLYTSVRVVLECAADVRSGVVVLFSDDAPAVVVLQVLTWYAQVLIYMHALNSRSICGTSLSARHVCRRCCCSWSAWGSHLTYWPRVSHFFSAEGEAYKEGNRWHQYLRWFTLIYHCDNWFITATIYLSLKHGRVSTTWCRGWGLRSAD